MLRKDVEGKSLYVRGLLQNYATSSYELICTLTYQSFLWPTLLRPWGGFTRKEEKTPYEFFEEKWFQAVNYYITKLYDHGTFQCPYLIDSHLNYY